MWTTTFKEQIPSISKSKVPRAAGENWQRTQTEFGFALSSLWFFTRRSQWHEMGLGDKKLVPLHVRNHFRYKPYKHCLYFCICDPHSAIFLPFPILSLLPYSVCWWAKPLSCLFKGGHYVMPSLLILFFPPANFHYDWKKVWQPSPLLFDDLWLVIELLLII